MRRTYKVRCNDEGEAQRRRWTFYEVIKYSLIVAIAGAVDLCNHIISKNGFRTPEDYADTFRVMEEKGAFDAEFINSLVQMARFRNRLVHIYWDIADAELYRIIQTRLYDINRFLKEFGNFIGI